MHNQILKETNYGGAGSVFIRRPQVNPSLLTAGVSTHNKTTNQSNQDSKIVCKRIDNSALNVTMKAGDLPSSQKFVPLAFPLENKKKGSQPPLAKNEGGSQELPPKHQSMPHTRFHSRQQSMPQSLPQSLPVSHNTSGYNLTFNMTELNHHDLKGLKGHNAHHYDPGFPEEAYRSSLGQNKSLAEKILSRSSNEKGQKKIGSPSKMVKKSSSSEKNVRGKKTMSSSSNKAIINKEEGRRTHLSTSLNNKPPKPESRVGGTREKRSEEGPADKSPGKGSKAVSPIRRESPQKKDKRKVKKREHVSKSEIPPALEELIQKNAHEYLEGIRAQKHISELEKRLHEERRAALEEGNRMIRMANMQRFNGQRSSSKHGQAKFAWGVDQRKFQEMRGTHGRHSSMGHQHPQKFKLDDKERRRMLGLDNLDEERLRELQRKAKEDQERHQREKSEEQVAKHRKQLDEEERMRLQDYMMQKRIRMEQEQQIKEISNYEDLERRRQNLEKLFRDIRYSRENERREVPKSKKKMKKRKTAKKGAKRGRGSAHNPGHNTEEMVPDEAVDDENYSALYQEYKKIINTKKGVKDESGSHSKQQGSHLQSRDINVDEKRRTHEESESYGERRSHSRKAENEARKVNQKKEEIKQKYFELSNRYQRNLINNIQALEGSINNNSSKKGSPPRGREKNSGEKRRKGGDRGGQSPYEQHDRSEAQEVIMEMETDNFSDNDYLKSERMMINNREKREEEDSDRVYDTEGNLPEESAREIIEAAAIFIQKNYRGYKTRKLLKMYFDQLEYEYQREQEEAEEGEEEEEEDDHHHHHHHHHRHGKEREHEEEEEDEEEHDEEEHGEHEEEYDEREDLLDYMYEKQQLQQRNMAKEAGRNKDNYQYQSKSHEYEHDEQEEGEEQEQEEVEYYEDEEEEGNFLDEEEKRSIMNLLERQKRQLEGTKKRMVEQQDRSEDAEELEEEGEVEDLEYDHEEGEEERESSEYIRAHDYSKNKSQSREQEDLGESGQQGSEEQYSEEEPRKVEHPVQRQKEIKREQVEVDHHHHHEEEEDDDDFGEIQIIRRARSDGELLENHRFALDYDDMEDSDQVSLHDDGENLLLRDYQEHVRIGFGGHQAQGYLQGIKMGDGKLEMESEEIEREEEEGGEDGEDEIAGDYQDEGELEYEEGFSDSNMQKIVYGRHDSAQIAKIPTIASVTVPTKTMVESQAIPNASIAKDLQQHKGKTESIFENQEIAYSEEVNESDIHQSHLDEQEPGSQSQYNSEAYHQESYPESYGGIQHNTSDEVVAPEEEEEGHEEQEPYDQEEAEEEEQEEKEEKPVSQNRPVNTVSDGTNEKELIRSSSENLRDQLIHELKVLVHDRSDKKTDKSFDKKEVLESGKTKKNEPEEEKKGEDSSQRSIKAKSVQTQSASALGVQTETLSTAVPQEREMIQKTAELASHYEQELARLKEEQAKKWNEIISQLDRLQSQGDKGLSEQARQLVENLARQSEINKRMLVGNADLASFERAQAGLTEEKNLMAEVNNLKNLQQRAHVPAVSDNNQKNVNVPQEETKAMVSDNSQPSLKKEEASSPSEAKFPKKRRPFEFAKKPNLEIEVSALTEENNDGVAAAINLELSQMRLALGSEQLVREQSARTLSQSLSTPTELELIDLNTPENNNLEGLVSIFERDPFKEFTHKKFRELMSQESMQKIIQMREQALEMRHKTQMDNMKRMLETRKFSPRTFNSKKIELEKWVTKERENIQKTKNDIEKGWLSTAESLKRTQRDLQFLQKVTGHGDGRISTASDMSIRHSFVDDAENQDKEKVEHGEASADKLVVRSPMTLKVGNEVKSPTSSKNIKIIDKFEIKDVAPSAEKEGHKKIEEAVQEAGKEPNELPESDDLTSSERYNQKGLEFTLQAPIKEFSDATQSGQQKSGNEKTLEDSGSKIASLERLDRAFSPELQKKKEEVQKDVTPKSISQRGSHVVSDKVRSVENLEEEGEIDLEAEVAEADEKDIDWQAELTASPEIVQKHEVHKHISRSEEHAPVGSRFKRHGPGAIDVNENLGSSATSSISPKTPHRLRDMFQEQIESLKTSQELLQKSQEFLKEPKSPVRSKKEEMREKSPDKHKEDIENVKLNLQKKADIVTEEVFKLLMDELGKEFVKFGQGRLAEKVKDLEEAPPLAGLQNLIENNYFFTQGAEKHPGFQANIPMLPAALMPEVEGVNLLEGEKYRDSEEDVAQQDNSLPMKSETDKEDKSDNDSAMKEKQNTYEYPPADTEGLEMPTEPQAELYKILGIRTDMIAVENYLDILLKEIKGPYIDEFLTNINIPIGLSVPEKLNNMHAYDLAGSESSLEMSAGLQQAILSIQLYLKIEEKLMDENPTKNEVSIELEHIHNKMIFDCLNEILDAYRPYGMLGEPYPWKTTIKASNPVEITRQNVDKILQKAKKKVIEWASSTCGYYGDRDDFIQDRTQSFAEDYLAQTKEEKLSKMLATEVHEMEDKWITYDDEEAEVQLEIADLIFDKLVTETAELIIHIHDERSGISGRAKQLLERPKLLEERKVKRKGSL